MALLYKGIRCSICHQVIENLKFDIVATTHFIADPNDPLHRFSDSAMHRRCYDAWEHHEVFTARYRAVCSPNWPDDK